MKKYIKPAIKKTLKQIIDSQKAQLLIHRIKRIWCWIAGHKWQAHLILDKKYFDENAERLGITNEWGWITLEKGDFEIGDICLRCYLGKDFSPDKGLKALAYWDEGDKKHSLRLKMRKSGPVTLSSFEKELMKFTSECLWKHMAEIERSLNGDDNDLEGDSEGS